MKNLLIRNSLYLIPCFVFTDVYSQQKVSGRITDEDSNALNSVLVFNISNNKKVQSDPSGQFIIEAEENEEIRFIKDGFYRSDKKITKDNISSPLQVKLLRNETLIPEVKIAYKPTGNLARDTKHFDEAKKTVALKSEMDKYMRTPFKVPLPENKISKTFSGHDFSTGQVDVVKLLLTGIGLVKKATKPKITKADYNETQSFMNRLKLEINLDFLVRQGMNEEQIDEFLIYANDTKYLAKKYRRDFNNDIIESELKIAFQEYSKTNKIRD
ncbi:hypothetical protein [Chryseobacterium paridis]|uniref:Carboxypeptidase regulatory-like domain-containing protein n=1 Tax=Chryseobacterium paridis TaxID=2800328 RepID=A0ABS1FP82_9FLAO|nr:hypothetical protein [Chryseobacterium paridis]MBK1894227.1 hypothetical protein [Chryseobacterium paridis]